VRVTVEPEERPHRQTSGLRGGWDPVLHAGRGLLRTPIRFKVELLRLSHGGYETEAKALDDQVFETKLPFPLAFDPPISWRRDSTQEIT
jgi:hypothetical protein